VGDVATFKVTDTITSPREKLPVTLLIPFGSNELPRSRIAAVAPSSTVISPAGGAPKIQRLRFSSGDSCAWKRVPRRAFHHIANHARTAARGNDGVDTGTARHVRGLQLVPIPPVPENAVTGDGAQRIVDAVNIGYQLGVRIVTRVGGEQPLLIGQKQ
jgi:hypothetical protein